ncbi:MAG: hypothetical protein U1F76_09155 [Candidatus Competibacteraceae bacterium]
MKEESKPRSLFVKTPALVQLQAMNPPDQPLAGQQPVEQAKLLVQVTEALMYQVQQPRTMRVGCGIILNLYQ